MTTKAAKKTVKSVPKKKNSKKTTTIRSADSLEGESAPKFSLPGTGDRNLDLTSGQPKKKLVLYFYPKDATPGCTIEGQDFGRLYHHFKNAGAEVYGISRDNMKSHEKFSSKMNFPFPLLSDENEKVCNLFKVIKDKNMYGKKVRGIERSTFVIDENGIIRKEWRKVKVDGHVREVLDYVKSL